MLLRRARVPVALLPAPLSSAAADPIEPAVLCDIRIAGDAIASVEAAGAADGAAPGEPEADCGGSMVFPGLVDAHVHLDKTHTWTRAPNRSGTWAEALSVLAADRGRRTGEDILRRADFGMRCAWARGTRLIRTHVDTFPPLAETAHAALAELRRRWRGRVELQTVPLCGGNDYLGAAGEAIADLALKHGASALGGFFVMNPDLPRQLDRLLALARDRAVGVDLHVDENGDPGAEVLRAVADAVVRNAFSHPVACGHACSLATQDPGRQRATIARVKEAGIGIISLPLCNLYLQDRRRAEFPRTPRWRGLTLVQDFLDAGVPVACASDNVRDAFHAHGDYDAAEVYVQSVRLAHLDERLAESVRVVTSSAAAIVGRPEFGWVRPGSPARLVIFEARSFGELLSRQPADRRCLDGEELRALPPPAYAELPDAAGPPA